MTAYIRTMVLVAAIGTATVSLSAMQAAGGAAASTAATAPPLSMRASCTGQGDAATVHATVSNTSNRDVAVLLGFLGGAEKTHVVNTVDIIAIRPATGADEDFLYVNGKYAAVTGRLEPWIVPLKAGAMVDVDLPVKDFISRMNYQPLDPAVVGGTRLVLDARPVTAAATKVWTGKVEAVVDICR